MDFWKNGIHLGTAWKDIFIDKDVSLPIFPAVTFPRTEPVSFSLNYEGPFEDLPTGYRPVAEGKKKN